MPGTKVRKNGQPDGRSVRWENSTAAERSAFMAELGRKRAVQARAQKIARLIEQAPPLTDEQRARLTVLLSGGTAPADAAVTS